MSEQSAPPNSLPPSQTEAKDANESANTDLAATAATTSGERRERHESRGERYNSRRHQSPLHQSSQRSNQSRRQQQQEGRGGDNLRADLSVGAAINMNELREVVELIAQHGFTDFELEREGFRVRLRRGNEPASPSVAPHFAPPPPPPSSLSSVASPPHILASQPAPSPIGNTASVAAVASSEATAQPDSDADLHIITSPIVGTFYRSPSPTSDSFVKQGSKITPDTVVCIVEAMKLMNEIPAEVSGTIEKIYVENAQPVEYGQPLFGVRK